MHVKNIPGEIKMVVGMVDLSHVGMALTVACPIHGEAGDHAPK